MALLKFLEDHFIELPTPMKVIVYFVVLILFVYLMVAPRFISGQIVANVGNGGYVPYRGVALQTRVAGRTMKFTTNEDGDWAIPVVSLIPGSLKVQVFHEDEASWFDVEILLTDVWRTLIDSQYRIVVNNSPPSIAVKRVKNDKHHNFLYALSRFFVSTSQAGQLILPKDIKSNVKEMKDDKMKIKVNVISAYSEVTQAKDLPGFPDLRKKGGDSFRAVLSYEKKNKQLLSIPINRGSKLTYVERIQLIEKIEKSQNIKIPDQHWKTISTLGDLSSYVYKRKLLENNNPELFKIQQSGDWANKIDLVLPIEQRPQFK